MLPRVTYSRCRYVRHAVPLACRCVGNQLRVKAGVIPTTDDGHQNNDEQQCNQIRATGRTERTIPPNPQVEGKIAQPQRHQHGNQDQGCASPPGLDNHPPPRRKTATTSRKLRSTVATSQPGNQAPSHITIRPQQPQAEQRLATRDRPVGGHRSSYTSQ